MMCRFCKRYTEYCREDRRAMLAYRKGFRAYAHLQCYLERKGRPAAEAMVRGMSAWRLKPLPDPELRERGLLDLVRGLVEEHERLIEERRNRPGGPTPAQIALAVEIGESLEKGSALVRKQPGDEIRWTGRGGAEYGAVLTAEDIAKAQGIVALGYGIAERLQEPDERKRKSMRSIKPHMLGPNDYLGEPEDLDRLGIPRSHTVISHGFGNKSKPPQKPETKPSPAGPEPPAPKSKD
jgi:hypothetical protein